MELKNWSGLDSIEKNRVREQVRDIFFAASSRHEFDSSEARDRFYWRWTHPYWEHWSEEVWLLTDRDGSAHAKVLGYLMGSLDTQREIDHFRQHLPSSLVFEKFFHKFPAHLHMNLAPRARGQGCGSRLIQHFIGRCRRQGLPGLHIVTSPESRNVDFYRKSGFDFEIEDTYRNYRLLFMACRLFE